MSLEVGQQLSSYTVIGPLGAGGMGEVYRAADSKLDREVAIKVLPGHLADDPERVARFDREAKLLAALNHPMIAAIYGLEEARGVRFLVLELVEGPTLADRLEGGRLCVDEALEVARQIAEALDVAHEKGIVHRDLKPANVKVTEDGQVKVLDFGLAKALAEEELSSDPAESPTITRDYTRPGAILGTAAYMSPEQARGREVDRRSDIWSFGCVLYQCLTGKSAFLRETVTDSMAAILHDEPDWQQLPAETPPAVRLLLRRCLTKDRKHRLRDMGDALIELRDPRATAGESAHESAPASAEAKQRRWIAALGWIAAACFVGLSAWLYSGGRSTGPPEATQTAARLQVEIDAEHPFSLAGAFWHTSLAISPDGNWVAYVGWGEPQKQLYYRRLDQQQWTAVPDSGGARSPFFSPDGDRLGFFTLDSLKIATLSTGERPETIARTIPVAGGACWENDESILFLPSPGGELKRIDVATRKEEAVFELEGGLAETEMLPGGQQVLVAYKNPGDSDYTIGVLDLRSKELQSLSLRGVNPHYDRSSSRIVYVSDGKILSIGFDVAAGETAGQAEVLDVAIVGREVAELSVSTDGRILYAKSASTYPRRLVCIDPNQPDGEPVFVSERSVLIGVDVDAQRARLATVGAGSDSRSIIGVLNLSEMRWETSIRSSQPSMAFPVWHPLQDALTFMGAIRVWQLELGGASEGSQLFDSSGNGADFPMSWHPSGDALLYVDEDLDRHYDIRYYDTKTEQTIDFLSTEFSESSPQFSPDGNWVAYHSNAQGTMEIFIQPFPPTPGVPILVSPSGGTEPRWSRDAESLRLFYRNGQKMMAVDFTPEASPPVSAPVELFQGVYRTADVRAEYDVDAQGRFWMIEPGDGESPTHLNIITNWNAEYLAR